MVGAKTNLKSYWFIEPEVILSVVLAVVCSSMFLLPHKYDTWISVSVIAGGAMVGAYRKRLLERLGPNRVKPPRLFRVFWWCVVGVQVLMFVVIVPLLWM